MLSTQTSTTNPSLDQSTTSEIRSVSNKKPVVVGIYGVDGSGKTFLLNQLKDQLQDESFLFLDGSQVIDSAVEGGLGAFQKMGKEDKEYWRRCAIEGVGKQCAESGKVAVVAGHYMLWPEEDASGKVVCTQSDLATYTHMLYLDVLPEVVAQRRLNDPIRKRKHASLAHLARWQLAEKNELKRVCSQHKILFSTLSANAELLSKVSRLLHDFKDHTEDYNLSCAKSYLDKTLAASHGQLETMIVMDADKTLAAEDTGILFWSSVAKAKSGSNLERSLNDLFSSRLGYSYAAFRQAVLLYEGIADDDEFEALCRDVASAVTIHPELVSLLRLVAEKTHVGALVVTCGLRRVWEMVLEKEGLADKVKVIGGGRIADGFIVSEAVKGALVTHLQEAYKLYVWAFGDGPLDLDMLKKADQAIVVVGEEQTRSQSMSSTLTDAIKLRARQVLLPSSASPRLDTKRLPILKLTDHQFSKDLFRRHSRQGGLQVISATDRKAAKLLATRMRDAQVAGPDLRDAHRRAGWYLAIEFLADVIGLEECRVDHVLNHKTTGFRLSHERQTTIVALMRGGEPMAFGVNDSFPLAMFVHASNADDLKLHHLRGQHAVILVDSVVNSGKTIIEFVERVRKLDANIRIIVVAGVVQNQCVAEGSNLNRALAPHGKVQLITLRISETKFTGSGTTDTGNRLFNTTHLD
ncbi:MAG: hypothetical protein M1812_006721 [Candelaria pacifica]|nr:MAG: hypothetical protein M1812_006721 [Candelaria pacifica]